ncbi:hypothetical protein RKE30_32730 [Streptomyces sp. Li-HN-5-11]|uniref:hypothetical protein n=1 Tax=Streptomyces sp. Li-HN-5-11 TaxID=3075432 RepID=UPI0028AF1A5E|nr:hypothetical protein [Streptomyces sp. Li-HN-5-11]WNM34799.1 hypothetical protein RKE30_32730 [Streptomyces sp. Li-HN-5-11]
MSDASTTQPLSAGAQELLGHGKHRGPVSAQDGETAPRGRHRKPAKPVTPVEETEAAA